MIAGTLIASGVLAGVTQALDAPVAPPMVFHHSLISAALLVSAGRARTRR